MGKKIRTEDIENSAITEIEIKDYTIEIQDLDQTTVGVSVTGDHIHIAYDDITPIKDYTDNLISVEALARSNEDIAINIRIDDEITDRTNADTALDLAKVNKAGDTMSGDLDFDQNKAIKLIIDNGTGFPASPIKGQIFYRSDLDKVYISTGAVWTPINLFFGSEDLTGQIDGIKTQFTLSNSPIPNSLSVILNGLVQNDYILVTNQVTIGFIPQLDDSLLLFKYIYY